MGKKGGDSLQGTKKKKEERFSFERQLATTKWKPPAQKLSCYWYCLVHVHGEKWGKAFNPRGAAAGGKNGKWGVFTFSFRFFCWCCCSLFRAGKKKEERALFVVI